MKALSLTPKLDLGAFDPSHVFGAEPDESPDPRDEVARAYQGFVKASLKLMAAIVRVDRARLYQEEGYEATAEWVHVNLAMGYRRACELTDVALALEELPRLADAYKKGKISYDHLRALVKVADRKNEAELAIWAEGATVGDTFRKVDEMKRLTAEDSKVAQRSKWVEMNWDHDSRLMHLIGVFPEEQGRRLEKAINALAKTVPDDPDDEITYGQRTAMGAKRADALAEMAGSAIAPPSARVVVHVPTEVLLTGKGNVELEGGPMVAAEVARRLACDSPVQFVYEDSAGRPVETSKPTYSVPARTRRALERRDRRCTYLGCRRRGHLQVHHIRHREHGGDNEIDNLMLVCEYHHRFLHNNKFKIRGSPPKVIIERPGKKPLKIGPP